MKYSRAIASGPWPRLQRAWDMRAACNFIGGGTGTGLLLAALVAGLVGRDWLIPALAGLAFIAFGLFMVLLEIGKPWRAFNVFLHPQTSWMTREGVLALPLFVLGVAALAANLAGLTLAALIALAAAALSALGFLYCQARILRAARGIPAWRDVALTPYMLVSGLAEGGALFAAYAALAYGAAGWAYSLAGAFVAARAIAWAHYRRGLGKRGAPEESLEVLDGLVPRFYLVGHALPVVLLIAARLDAPGAVWLAVAGGLIAAICGWRTKLILITRAARTQGVAIPRTPVRGRGKSHAGAKPGWSSR